MCHYSYKKWCDTCKRIVIQYLSLIHIYPYGAGISGNSTGCNILYPIGNTLYTSGAFNTVNGINRTSLTAFNTNVNNTISIGYQSGYNGQNNTAISIGYQSGYYAQQGNTVAIGYQAGYSSQGTGSICIGTNSGLNSIGTNCICIGNGASTGQSLAANTFATITNMATIAGGATLTYNTFTGLIGVASSSQRYKDDIQVFTPSFSDNVLVLEPVTFKFKSNQQASFGLIAEEVFKYYPEMAPTDHDNIPYTVNYELLSVLLLDRVKKLVNIENEQALQLENLQHRIDILEENCI